MSDNTETVNVPKALLAEVLDTAESDSYSTQNEFSCSAAEDERYAADRERIRELRKLAGLDDSEVVGHGFFGIVTALQEHDARAKTEPAPPAITPGKDVR